MTAPAIEHGVSWRDGDSSRQRLDRFPELSRTGLCDSKCDELVGVTRIGSEFTLCARDWAAVDIGAVLLSVKSAVLHGLRIESQRNS